MSAASRKAVASATAKSSTTKKQSAAASKVKKEIKTEQASASAKSKAVSVKTEKSKANGTTKKPSAPATPEKKRQSKLQMKEEQKSSAKKMGDKDFKKFLEQVQVAAVQKSPLPAVKEDKKSAKGSTALAGSKRPASKAATA